MSLRASVVVPTYKRPDLLQRCLAALLTQDFDPSAFEIVVVDDAANQDTQQLVEKLAQQTVAYRYLPLPSVSMASSSEVDSDSTEVINEHGALIEVKGLPLLRYLPVNGQHGPAAARNTGWQAAAGDIIAFTDDDCLPASDWLKNGLEAFNHNVEGVTGQVIVPMPDDPTDYEWDVSGLQTSKFVTANCFYRRSALQMVGGFDQAFTCPWREDSDLFFTLLEKGFQLEEAPTAVVVHPVRPAPWGISLRTQHKSVFNALLFKKHPGLYREYIQPTPPLHYYFSNAIFLGVVVSALLGNWGLSLAFLIAWAALTVNFTAWRLRHTSRSPCHVLEMIITSIFIPFLATYYRLKGAVKYRVWFI